MENQGLFNYRGKVGFFVTNEEKTIAITYSYDPDAKVAHMANVQFHEETDLC